MRASLLAGSFAVVVSFQGAEVVLAQPAPPPYVVTDVGDLGGGEAIASAINSSGQVVGFSYLAGHKMGNTCDEKNSHRVPSARRVRRRGRSPCRRRTDHEPGALLLQTLVLVRTDMGCS